MSHPRGESNSNALKPGGVGSGKLSPDWTVSTTVASSSGLDHRFSLRELTQTAAENFANYQPQSEVQRKAVAGIRHALKPGSMSRDFAPRRLLNFTPTEAEPLAAIMIGDDDAVANPTHITWQIHGVYYRTDTTAWGASQESATLHWAQTQAGAPRPLVINWLGYHAPNLLAGLTDAPARSGAKLLRESFTTVTATTTVARATPKLNIDAHSYGALTALYALDTWVPPPRFHAAVLSGAIGAPAGVQLGDLPVDNFHVLRAQHDYHSRLGSLLGRFTARRKLLKTTDISTVAGTRLVGHNTHGGTGYRDVGTQGLEWMAQHTV